MSVNGIELAVGQQWTTSEYGVVTLYNEGVSEEYPWCAKPPHISITPDGKYWDDDEEPILLECIYNPAQPKQLSPQPGDKIICNNGEEFVQCTLEFLREKGCSVSFLKSDAVVGYREEPTNETTGVEWCYWGSDGSSGYSSIKEIISAVQQEVKQEVKEDTPAPEKTYTLEQIKEAFDALQWSDDSFELLSDKLKETQDPEYKLYLELKAKFEGKE